MDLRVQNLILSKPLSEVDRFSDLWKISCRLNVALTTFNQPFLKGFLRSLAATYILGGFLPLTQQD